MWARAPAAAGSYTLSGSGYFSVSNYEYVGDMGSGTFTQTGGTNSAILGLYLGNSAGGSGSYNLSGSGYQLSKSGSDETVGYSGSGTFTQSGGTNSVGSSYVG